MSGIVSRRNLLKLSAGAVGTGVVTAGLGSEFVFPQKAVAKENAQENVKKDTELTPEQALKLLLEGNERFVSRRRQNPHQSFTRIEEVAKGQKPFASILGCADSRVPSEIIFDQGFGDLFVCRVAGNIATPEETGSLEFGSLVLGAKVIMVVGHERCGAVEATVKGAQVPGQIASLVAAIKPGIESAKNLPGDKLENACKANVLTQIEKLKTSPILSQLISEKKLVIAGGYYDLDTGRVTLVT